MSEKVIIQKDRTGLYFSVFAVLLLILFLILGIYLVRTRTNIAPRAKESNVGTIISLENSYIFASPVRARSGGELIRVTVFVLDSQGLGVFDKKVSLGNSSGPLNISAIQELTDESGKAIFDVGSNTSGTYYIESSVDGQSLPQKVKITFD